MDAYELTKKIFDEFPYSDKEYVCLNGYDYAFLNEYSNKYELCTKDFDVVLVYLKIYDPKSPFIPMLLSRLGYAGATSITLRPPFSIYNNAVYIWLGKELKIKSHVTITKTSTGYNDSGKPIIVFDAIDDLNPMSIEAISHCAKLVFMYNKKIECGVYGVEIK